MSTRKSAARPPAREVPQFAAVAAIALIVLIIGALAWKLLLAAPPATQGQVPPGMPGGPPASAGTPAFVTPAPGSQPSAGAPAGYGPAPAQTVGGYQQGDQHGTPGGGPPPGYGGPPPGFGGLHGQ